MRTSSLVKLLSFLPKKQLTPLSRYLASPYFNSNPTLFRLFEILRDYHPRYTSSDCTKQQVYLRLFPDKEYNDSSMRNLMSKLAEHIRQFLAQEKFQASPELQDRLLLQQYGKYKIEVGFNDLYKKQMARLEKASKMDRFACLEHYLTLDEMLKYSIIDTVDLEENFYQELSDHLDRFFALSKVTHRFSTNSRRRFLNEQPPTSSFDNSIDEYIQSTPEKDQIAFDFMLEVSNLQLKKTIDPEPVFEKFKKIYHFFTDDTKEVIFKIFTVEYSRVEI